ncbi:MAG: hypothetical protein AAGE84_07055 [Cyanobacteria bacterium P01_G01_bin.39]
MQNKEANVPALLFAGDFNYLLAEKEGQSNSASMCETIDNWQQDVSLFQEKISQNIIKTAQAALSEQPNLSSQLETEKVAQ